MPHTRTYPVVDTAPVPGPFGQPYHCHHSVCDSGAVLWGDHSSISVYEVRVMRSFLSVCKVHMATLESVACMQAHQAVQVQNACLA
eukprot:scaffold45134_cov18-Tisochrysis_lutea.AAC.2